MSFHVWRSNTGDSIKRDARVGSFQIDSLSCQHNLCQRKMQFTRVTAEGFFFSNINESTGSSVFIIKFQFYFPSSTEAWIHRANTHTHANTHNTSLKPAVYAVHLTCRDKWGELTFFTLHFPLFPLKYCIGNGHTNTCAISYNRFQSPNNNYYLCELFFFFSRTASEMCCFDTMGYNLRFCTKLYYIETFQLYFSPIPQSCTISFTG